MRLPWVSWCPIAVRNFRNILLAVLQDIPSNLDKRRAEILPLSDETQ